MLSFFLQSAILAAAAVGWFKRRLWGWGLAVGIIFTQVVGDLVNFVKGDLLRGGTGLTIAGALLSICSAPESGRRFINPEILLSEFYKTIAATSTVPSAIQHAALPRSPASQYPVAALKQRAALDHPLAHAAGLLSIFGSLMG